MARIDDDDPTDDLIGSDDYEVIPRPQELIELQKRSSSSKSKQTSDKSGSNSSKRSENKGKEKRPSNKHTRKGSSKVKPLYKLPFDESLSKKYLSELEIESKFEAFVQNAKSSIHRHKSEPLHVAGNESSDLIRSRNKSLDPDASKYLDIQYSKIMDEPAITSLERFKVLDARDTAIRSRSAKQDDSKKTKIIGSCPDMCPEKERYSRIAKNCLSVLEMTTVFNENATPRDANHSYMVKEYSRSSADQQEPLSHELRPIPVLMFTMDYLICNIMDLPLGNISLADWYDFIWNRTRSIRKDITQQQLCDIQCVEIIEKCVRFHIHCAEALSEEEAAIFDPKINNENLTKCLQTLKHMYHDLQSKGIQCPNEAEFRSYDILLSLTEGETLRLIKDIRKDLLKSPLIKFAFNAALAFKSHNYVKFFKLIEKANYLSSCILHRYIPEARIRALQIIVRAYSTPHISSSYPIASLTKDLKFENLAEASEFCRCHRLEVDDTYIIIERKQFSRAASGLTPSRSFLLVGSKMGQSLGKVINKGELPANPLKWYQPHNSFDERNILKISSLGSVTKVDAELPKDGLPPPVTIASTFFKPLPPTCTSVFPTVSTESKAVGSVTSSFAPPTTSNFNFFSKANDPFANASKEQPLFCSQPVSNSSTSFHGISQTEKNAVSSGISRKAFELPSTEEFFSFGRKPSAPPETEVGYPEEEAESVMMESNNESSNDAFMMDAEEIVEESTSSLFLKENMFSSSPKPIFNKNELIFNKTEDDFVGLPTRGISSSHPTFSMQGFEFQKTEKVLSPREKASPHSTSVLHFSGTEKVCSPREKSSPHSTSVLHFLRTEKVCSPREKSSVLLEKEKEYEEARIPVIDLVEDSESSIEEIENEVNKLNEKEREGSEFDEIIEDVVEDLFSEIIQEYLFSVCEEVLNAEKHKTAKLRDELEIIRTNLALKTILKWKFFCERKHQRRRFENSTFCSPWQPMLLNTPYVTTGAASPIVVYKKHCFLSKHMAEKIKKRKEITPGWEEFNAEDIWPLKAFRPYPSAYLGKSGFKFFFKLCIVFPSEFVSSGVKTFMEWICAKFSLQKMQNFKFDTKNTFMLHNKKTLVSVRALQLGGHSSFSYAKFLDGITAMILFVPPSSETNGFYEDFTTLLDADSLQCPYPLFVYFLEKHQKSPRLKSFLQEKLDARYFTEFKIECLSEVKYFKENSNKVSEALSWLLAVERKDFSHPWLYKCSFTHYLEDSFTFAFNILLCKVSLDEFKCLKQMPHHIINFYNKVLKFRSSVLCSDLLERIHSSWPPTEIKLHIGDKIIDIKIQKECQKKMESLLLPNLEEEPLCSYSIWDYVKHVASIASRDQDMLFIRIKNALNSTSDDWLTVINICALHIIHAQNLELSLSSEDLPVYYTKEDLETFDCDEFWMEVSSDIRSFSILNSSKRKSYSTLVSPVKRGKWEMSDVKVTTASPLEKKINFISNAFDMPDILSCQRENLFAPLRAAFAKQVEQSEAFIHRLNESVQNVDASPVTLSDDEFLEEKDISSSNTNSYDSSFQSKQDLNTQQNSGVDLLCIDSSRTSFSSIADKISELKYNIQKSNILEDHFSQLLSEQL